MTAQKASNMVGLGPIDMDLMGKKHRKDIVSFERFKILAVEDLLSKYIEYDKEELEELTIVETRLAANGEKVIYIALHDHEQIKEIYVQKVEMKDDVVTVRNYMPPNYYNRFTYVNAICREERMKNS